MAPVVVPEKLPKASLKDVAGQTDASTWVDDVSIVIDEGMGEFIGSYVTDRLRGGPEINVELDGVLNE